MTVPLSRSRGKPLVTRVKRDKAGQFATSEKRRRTDDLLTLLIYTTEHTGVVPLFEEEADSVPRAYDVGFALTVRQAGRAIGLEPELYQSESKRKHFSPDQLQYIADLVLDLPDAFGHLLAKIRAEDVARLRAALEERLSRIRRTKVVLTRTGLEETSNE